MNTTIVESTRKAIMGGVIAKSILMGIAAAIIDVSFVKAALLVILSATVTGAFGLLIAHLQIRAQRNLGRRIDQVEQRQISVAQQTGADPTLPARKLIP